MARHDPIQRVLNAAARVVSGTRKFDRGLSKLLHSELHWLDIPQRVQYKLGSHSPPVSAEQGSSVPSGLRQAHIRRLQPSTPSISQPLPVNEHLLFTTNGRRNKRRKKLEHQTNKQRYGLTIVPRHRRSMFGRRAFSVAGPMEWNSLPDSLCDENASLPLI